MPVVSVNLKSVEAKKIADAAGTVKVNNKASIVKLDEIDLPGIDKKGLTVDFEFTTDYNVEGKTVAEIKMTGFLMYVGDDYKEVLKKWKKDNEVPVDVHIEMINTILRRCISRAILLAEDIQLPPPIGLPFAQKEEKKE